MKFCWFFVFSFLLLLFWFFTPLAQADNSLGCVNINTAPKEELEKIMHIGASRAEQIINLREEMLFISIDDLERVIGIGPSRLADIKEQGLACTSVAKTISETASITETANSPKVADVGSPPAEIPTRRDDGG